MLRPSLQTGQMPSIQWVYVQSHTNPTTITNTLTVLTPPCLSLSLSLSLSLPPHLLQGTCSALAWAVVSWTPIQWVQVRSHTITTTTSTILAPLSPLPAPSLSHLAYYISPSQRTGQLPSIQWVHVGSHTTTIIITMIILTPPSIPPLSLSHLTSYQVHAQL